METDNLKVVVDEMLSGKKRKSGKNKSAIRNKITGEHDKNRKNLPTKVTIKEKGRRKQRLT